MKKWYLPLTDAGRSQWLNNFAAKLPAYAAKYGIAAGEAADTVAGATYFAALLNGNNQWREYVKSLTDYKDAMRNGVAPGATATAPVSPAITLPATVPLPGIIGRATSLANRIKSHSSYTEADGQNLGLEGAELGGKAIPDAPQLKLAVEQGGHVCIIWTKMRGVDAIEIQVDRGQGWELLAVDTVPDYVDTFALPAGHTAQWKYRAIYRYKDERVGDWSDVASIAVAG